MKRWFIYAAVLVLVTMSPLQGVDIGRLSPVETVWMEQREDGVYLRTDAGAIGWGENAKEALENLRTTSSGIIFLETADYLVLRIGSEKLLEQLTDVLRPSCMICVTPQMPDLQSVTDFFLTHEPNLTYRQWQVEGCALPYLIEQEGRFAWRDGTYFPKTV